MLRLTFGDSDEVVSTARRINGIHATVRGGLTHDEGGFAGGTAYSASDPALLRWVHLTCADSFLKTYELYVRPLTAAERNAYCSETAESESLFGLPRGSLPRDAGEVERSMTAIYDSGILDATETAQSLARAVLFPTPAWVGWPLTGAVRLSTLGLMPPHLRTAFGFAWSSRDERRFTRLVRTVRTVRRAMPPPLRYWAMARRAMRRRV